jgi:hypothetical protein
VGERIVQIEGTTRQTSSDLMRLQMPIGKVDKAAPDSQGIASQEIVDADGQVVDAKQAVMVDGYVSKGRWTPGGTARVHPQIPLGRPHRRHGRYELPCAVGSGRRPVARSGWSFRVP